MRYWAYLVAKLAVAGVVLLVLRKAIAVLMFHQPVEYTNLETPLFLHDLPYTFAMLLLALLAAGVMWLIVWDQRYRCRTCLRRLRMPVCHRLLDACAAGRNAAHRIHLPLRPRYPKGRRICKSPGGRIRIGSRTRISGRNCKPSKNLKE